MQFITDFMVRAAFANTYNSPNTPADNTAYVDALLNTAGDFFYSFALTLTNFVTGMTRRAFINGALAALVVLGHVGHLTIQPRFLSYKGVNPSSVETIGNLDTCTEVFACDVMSRK